MPSLRRDHLSLPFRWKTRNRISLEPAWQSFGSMPSLTIDFELSSIHSHGFSANRATSDGRLVRSDRKGTICPSRMEIREGGGFILRLRLGNARFSIAGFLENKLSIVICKLFLRFQASLPPLLMGFVSGEEKYRRGIFLLMRKKFYEKMWRGKWIPRINSYNI